MSQVLELLASGAVTAVGNTAPQTAAAVRARIAGFRAAEFLVGSSLLLSEMSVAQVEGPSPADVRGLPRLASIGALALRECLEKSGADAAEVPLLLCVRDAYRDDANSPDGALGLQTALEAELGVRFHPDSAAFEEGRAGAFVALLQARELIARGRATCCIVGGVDSLLNLRDLHNFHAAYRLLNPPVSRGLIPGEGAAFVAVGPQRRRSNSATHILGIGIEREAPERTVLSDGHPTGQGLARALSAAAADARVEEREIVFHLSDLNGERYYGVDSALAMTRFYQTHRDYMLLEHPADCVGDLGAAMGALQLVIADAAFSKAYAPGPLAMCEGSSDAGLRAGCVIAAAPGG